MSKDYDLVCGGCEVEERTKAALARCEREIERLRACCRIMAERLGSRNAEWEMADVIDGPNRERRLGEAWTIVAEFLGMENSDLGRWRDANYRPDRYLRVLEGQEKEGEP